MIWRICCIGPDIVTTNWWCTILMEKNGMLIPFEIILTIFLGRRDYTNLLCGLSECGWGHQVNSTHFGYGIMTNSRVLIGMSCVAYNAILLLILDRLGAEKKKREYNFVYEEDNWQTQLSLLSVAQTCAWLGKERKWIFPRREKEIHLNIIPLIRAFSNHSL
jgi:hypothetical protein